MLKLLRRHVSAIFVLHSSAMCSLNLSDLYTRCVYIYIIHIYTYYNNCKSIFPRWGIDHVIAIISRFQEFYFLGVSLSIHIFLWSFKIAMENDPFTDESWWFTSLKLWFSVANCEITRITRGYMRCFWMNHTVRNSLIPSSHPVNILFGDPLQTFMFYYYL